jgi:hypothetical protein
MLEDESESIEVLAGVQVSLREQGKSLLFPHFDAGVIGGAEGDGA